MSYTLNDVQIDIALDFDSSATPPAVTNSEWSRRLALINRAERLLAQSRKYHWSWLYKEATLSTTAGVATVALPTDFKFGNLVLNDAGEIKIGSQYLRVVPVGEKDSYKSSAQVCWISGNDAIGYMLNIQPTPTSVSIISLNYYSTSLATSTLGVDQEILAIGTDKTKIPYGIYLAYITLAQLFKDDDEGTKGIDFERLAVDKNNEMLSLENSGQANQFGEIPEVAERRGFPGIGG